MSSFRLCFCFLIRPAQTDTVYVFRCTVWACACGISSFFGVFGCCRQTCPTSTPIPVPPQTQSTVLPDLRIFHVALTGHLHRPDWAFAVLGKLGTNQWGKEWTHTLIFAHSAQCPLHETLFCCPGSVITAISTHHEHKCACCALVCLPVVQPGWTRSVFG